MKTDNKKPIVSFHDLRVYQSSYKASITVMTKVVPMLPNSEKYDLKDQMSRSCKAVPRLIAEGTQKGIKSQVFRNILMMLWPNVMR